MSASGEERVDADALRDRVIAILERVAVPPDEAELLATTLVEADLRGMHSHGVMRVPVYVEKIRAGGFKPGRKGRIVRETASTVLLDGDDGIGQVIAARAMREAIRKAREAGSGTVGVTRSNHFGEAAFYALIAVEAGMIGLVTTNGSPNMPVWGGLTKISGPLPLAVGVPTRREFPIVLDMALGVVAKGKILYAAEKGETIPPGWGVDAAGRPTEDPQKVLDGGWTLPIGGYKGWGLILMLEILSGALTGGRIGGEITNLYGGDLSDPQGIGHFMIAIDVEAFVPRERFLERMDAMVAAIKGSELAPGFEEILLPGERELRLERERRRTGIPISRRVLDEIDALARELNA